MFVKLLKVKVMKNKMKALGLGLVMLSAMTMPVYAAGGLDKATSAVEEFRFWLYTFLGVGCICYMVYQIILAMLEKQPWGDVVTATGKVAVAGGSVALATFAWSIWGS